MSTDKLICEECGWRGTESEMLTAPNPFDHTAEIYGCPNCRNVDTLICACEHEGCWRGVSAGTPTTDGGYTQTCHEHAPTEGETAA